MFLAAAKVGGIQADNNYPAAFIRDNLLIEVNLTEATLLSLRAEMGTGSSH